MRPKRGILKGENSTIIGGLSKAQLLKELNWGKVRGLKKVNEKFAANDNALNLSKVKGVATVFTSNWMNVGWMKGYRKEEGEEEAPSY